MQPIDWNSLKFERPVGGDAVKVESFAGKNEVFMNYGIGLNDVIAFPPVDKLDEMRFTQKSKSLGTDVSLLGVVRNGKPSYLAIGSLSSTDRYNQPVDDFRREMLDFQDAEMRVQYLCKKGAVIKGARTKSIDMPKFKDRKKVDEPNVKDVVIVEYV